VVTEHIRRKTEHNLKVDEKKDTPVKQPKEKLTMEDFETLSIIGNI